MLAVRTTIFTHVRWPVDDVDGAVALAAILGGCRRSALPAGRCVVPPWTGQRSTTAC
jgi:hypothetical protein